MKWFNAICEVLDVRHGTYEAKELAEMVDETICDNTGYTDEEVFAAVCKRFTEKYRAN